jgi:hypothetical protein
MLHTRLRLSRFLLIALAVPAVCPFAVSAEDAGDPRIRPYTRNPRYWQYQGKPLLLVGGSKDDNPFQLPDLKEHLDEMKAVGGNYLRNTMSDRHDGGFEVYPYKQLPEGKYDLDQWNEEYWTRFQNFLRLTRERDHIVQIEVWDPFDHSQEYYERHPYRPANNVNYTTDDSGLADRYPVAAWMDRQPFFHSIPGMPRYTPSLDVIRRYQERFVARMLSDSLDYGNVLYCMNNETSTPPAWGRHWIAFIEEHARRKGVSVYCTDMFNDAYRADESKLFAQAFDDTAVYKFLDISQINSRIFNEDHWTRLQWVMKRIEKHPRPVNNVKIYGSGETRFGSGTPVDGVERLWRDLLAGCAAVRSHRDGGGIGLQPISKATIKAVRKVETLVQFWDVQVHQELLTDREPDEAYLVARPGRSYVLYFTQGGAVGLNLTGHEGEFRLRWIDISTGEWGTQDRIPGGKVTTISAPAPSPWVAVLIR